jgi:hypothetical protein
MFAAMFLALAAHGADLSPDFELKAALSLERLGLQADLRPGLRMDLWRQDGSLLFDDPYATLQAQVFVTPAYVRAGPRLIFEPIAIFQLQAFANYDMYFGNFQTVVGYDDPGATYGTNDDIEAYVAMDPDRQERGTGWHWGVAPTLKAQAGPVVIVANAEYSSWHTQPVVPGSYTFEREYELLMGWDDQLISTNGLLLYGFEPWQGATMRVGNLTTWRMALGDTEDELLRTGIAVAASLNDGQINPTLVVQAYLRDRAYTSPFPPFVGLMMRWAPS